MISALNIVSFLALMMTSFLIIRRLIKRSNQSLIAFLFAVGLLTLSEFTNVLEHLNLAPQTDQWEDLLEVVFLPLLILSLHIGMLEDELYKRRITENKFEAIYNNAYTFIGLLDGEGRFLDANEASTKTSSIDPTKQVGQYFWDTLWWSHSKEEQIKIKKAISKVKQGQTSRFQSTHFNTKNGTSYIDHSLTPVYDHEGKVIYMIAEGRNVTQLTLVLKELEEHKNELEKLVTEKTRELNAALRVSKQLNEKLYNSNQQLEKSNLELKKQSKYLQLTLDQLQEAQNQLIESEKMASLGILTAGVAHEINNPLNFIMGGVTGIDLYASEHLTAHDEGIKQPLQSIYSGIERITKIVKSLNTYSRTDNFEKTECNLNTIIDDCLIILQNKWKHRIEITKQYDPNALIEANEGRIHQVFLNLINNAIQAIDNKGKIVITTMYEKGEIIAEIEDSVSGFSPENMKKIFDPFFTTKEPNQGTGLGLSISQKIISDYHGSIKYVSLNNKGTKVIVTFPKGMISAQS